MHFAFIIGEFIIVGVLILGFIFWAVVVGFLIWQWHHAVVHRLQYAAGYLMLVVLPCLAFLIPQTRVFSIIFGMIFTLPLGFFAPWLLREAIENYALPAILFLCGVANAAAFYLIASFWARRKGVK